MSEPLRCLIVDDEPAAHYVLVSYIGRVERLRLAGQCYNALEALNWLHQHPTDLLFLDINMPELSGLDLLRSLANLPKVILTTAHAEFALESYDVGVADYLLKPIPFPRFLKAIERVLSSLPGNVPADSGTLLNSPPPAEAGTSMMVRVDGDWVRVALTELLYAQSWGNYVKLFLPNHMLLTPMTTADLEARLPPDRFVRIHKSYVVALDKIDRLSGNVVQVGPYELPVGPTFRRGLVERMG